MALANQLRWISRVLNDAVTVDDIEYLVRVRQLLAVRDAQLLCTEIVQGKILAGKIDRRLRQVDARHSRAAACKPDQVGADAAAHFEQPPIPERRKVHQHGQVMQLVEAVVVEIVKECLRADFGVGHLEVVDPLVPVALNGVDHKFGTYTMSGRCSATSASWRTPDSTCS